MTEIENGHAHGTSNATVSWLYFSCVRVSHPTFQDAKVGAFLFCCWFLLYHLATRLIFRLETQGVLVQHLESVIQRGRYGGESRRETIKMQGIHGLGTTCHFVLCAYLTYHPNFCG